MSEIKRALWSMVVLGSVMLIAALALAQSTSAPASQTTASSAALLWAWCTANANWLVPVVIEVLSTLITGLTKYPKAGGAVGALRLLLAVFSVVTHKDAPGTFKLPCAPAVKPEGVM